MTLEIPPTKELEESVDEFEQLIGQRLHILLNLVVIRCESIDNLKNDEN